MVILNMGDGSSRKYDLTDPSQLAALNVLGRGAAASEITGVWVNVDGYANTVPVPRGFRSLTLEADVPRDGDERPVGERVTCHVDDVRLSVLAHYDGRSTRIFMQRIGRPRYVPSQGG